MGKLISWEEWCLGRRRTAQPGAYAPPDNIVSESKAPSGIQKLNEATEEDLTSIKGIGPKKAQMILENRPFADFEELAALKGVSEKVCESIKSWTT